MRYCNSCNDLIYWEAEPKSTHDFFPQGTSQALDWRHSITLYLENVDQLNHVDTHEQLGLFSNETETYFITEEELKYRLSNGEIEMCITREDAYEWVKMIHEYQDPHLIKEVLTQTHQGPYWWPTIFLDVEHIINKCETCQITTMFSQEGAKHDWRDPIIQHLKQTMKLSNSAFHEELGVPHKELPHYFVEEGKLKQSFANEQIKLCIFQEKRIEWLNIIHNQRYPHISMDEMILQVTIGPYWWPTIPPDIDHLCKECRVCWPNISLEHSVDCKTITIKEKEELDWRTPFIDYLIHSRLTTEASTIQR